MRLKKILAGALAAALVLTGLPVTTLAANGYVKKLEIDESELTMEINDLEGFEATVTVSGNASTEVKAESSDESVVYVSDIEGYADEPGTYFITIESGEKTGSAVITVKTVGKGQDGKTLSGKVDVDVVAALPEEPEELDAPEMDDRTDGKYDETDGSKTEITTDDGEQTIVNVKETETEEGKFSTKTTTVIKDNGDYYVREETTDSSGKVVESKELTQTTNEDGSVQETAKVLSKDGTSYERKTLIDTAGNSESTKVMKDKNGNVSAITNESKKKNEVSSLESCAVNSGKASLAQLTTEGQEAVIPDFVEDFQGNQYAVSEISEGAVNGIDKVTVGKNIKTIRAEGISGATELIFMGKVKKSMFKEGALEGCGTVTTKAGLAASGKSKAGKGLTIYVQTKKDRKAMKKSRRKAGVPGAKVRLYRLR